MVGVSTQPTSAASARAASAVLAALMVGLLLLALCARPAAAEEFEKERKEALSLGLEAYEYGQPLLDSQRIYKAITSVTVPNEFGEAPVNQFSHFKALATEKEGCVVA